MSFIALTIASQMIVAALSPMDSLKKSFHGKTGFEVSFTQEVKDDIFPGGKETASGTVKFVRPDRLVWAYEKPRKRIIRYEQKKLSIEQNGEVEAIRDFQALSLQDSFSFLWGEASANSFKVELKSESQFRILPKKNLKAAFQFIDVTTKNGFVEQAIVKNKVEGESLIQFSNWKTLTR